MRALIVCVCVLIAGAGNERPAYSAALLADAPPESLADWRLFERNGETLTVRSTWTAYDLNTPLFSDYAHKLRMIHLPAGARIRYADDAFEFPLGTIITKTFYYPLARASAGRARTSVQKAMEGGIETSLDLRTVRLIETRILAKTARGWIALPYVWDAAQHDAALELAGDSIELTLIDGARRVPFVYMVPDANQCAGCHGAGARDDAIAPIGVKARHLNKMMQGDTMKNQLAYWHDADLLDRAPRPNQAPRNATWNDSASSIDALARAYLDANCAHCHSSAGAANSTGLSFDARETDPVRLGLCKIPVATGRGSGTASFGIVPGAPDESILVHRMESTEPDIAMPEIGRALVHAEGVALVRQWIAAMEGACE